MHYWGDDWFQKHGDDLNAAISYCLNIWNRWGRIGTAFSKEKFGSFRHNVQFYTAEWPIYQLINPGYVGYQWPRFFMKVEQGLGKVLARLGFVWLVNKYQEAIYNYALQQVCKKYPEIIYELVSDSDYPELIKPGIFGKVDGLKVFK